MSSENRRRRRRVLLREQGQTCAHCGKRSEKLTLDHIIPKSKGGPDALWNLQLLCYPCNRKKGNHVDVECFFFQVAA